MTGQEKSMNRDHSEKCLSQIGRRSRGQLVFRCQPRGVERRGKESLCRLEFGGALGDDAAACNLCADNLKL